MPTQVVGHVVIKRKRDKRAWRPVWPWNPYIPHVVCPVCNESLDQKQLKRDSSYKAIVDGVRIDAHIACVDGVLLTLEGDARAQGVDYGNHFY